MLVCNTHSRAEAVFAPLLGLYIAYQRLYWQLCSVYSSACTTTNPIRSIPEWSGVLRVLAIPSRLGVELELSSQMKSKDNSANEKGDAHWWLQSRE